MWEEWEVEKVNFPYLAHHVKTEKDDLHRYIHVFRLQGGTYKYVYY